MTLKSKKEYYLENRERLLEQFKEYYLKNKERFKERKREWHLKNREKRLKQMAEYNLKNKGRLKEQKREWYLKNIEHKKEYYLKNYKHILNHMNNRYRTDINFRLKVLCRNRVRLALKGLDKSASTMKLIGCTPDELRRHIESLFEPWMTWENQGKGGWDIDHIEACFHFNLTDPEQQRACFNWSNLQPMEHIANIKKGTG